MFLSWFAWIFVGALSAALYTGKAYFRGLVHRAESPRRYWVIIFFYTVLTAAAVISSFLPAGMFYLITDGATRIAYEIEAATPSARASGTYTLIHRPRAWPSGCAQSYQIQFVERSSIVIWCKDPNTGKTTSSHSTTYHRNFVSVPKGFMLQKNAGEATIIELALEGSEVVIRNAQ